MLRRLLRNLFENARRHGGGTPIEAFVEMEGDGVRLMVCDAGPGVPERERQRIFEPFYHPQGMPEGEDRGGGLGLALVREIARRHGGEARCVPRKAGGTCIKVLLSAVAPSLNKTLR